MFRFDEISGPEKQKVSCELDDLEVGPSSNNSKLPSQLEKKKKTTYLPLLIPFVFAGSKGASAFKSSRGST